MSKRLPPVIDFAAVDFWYHNRAHSEIQLMTRLSKHTKVLFINSIGMRAPLPGRSSNPGFRIWRKVKSLFRGLRRPLENYRNFYVFTPVIIPAYSTPWLRRVNFFIIRFQVRCVMALLHIRKPIVVETIPTANEVAPKLRPLLEIVYRVDLMSAFGETDKEYIESLERNQISRAVRTYYTASELMKDEEALHQGKARQLDHGVDLVTFSPKSENEERPLEFADIDTPIVGFFGGIDDYVIDLSLLKKIANDIPDATLVLIGEATCDIETLTSQPNVVWLGFKSVEEVALLGAHFDVAILPRLGDQWTKYTNPIKIKEYLALGLPIVSMDIPEIHKYANDIAIVSNHDEFISAIKDALSTGSTQIDRQHRRSLVESDTWDQRSDELVADMRELTSCAE
jgi:glycosyltransferase involved in cell wall biosynthesis